MLEKNDALEKSSLKYINNKNFMKIKIIVTISIKIS
jgi:hypothetical protein